MPARRNKQTLPLENLRGADVSSALRTSAIAVVCSISREGIREKKGCFIKRPFSNKSFSFALSRDGIQPVVLFRQGRRASRAITTTAEQIPSMSMTEILEELPRLGRVGWEKVWQCLEGIELGTVEEPPELPAAIDVGRRSIRGGKQPPSSKPATDGDWLSSGEP